MSFGWRYFLRRVLVSLVLLWLLSVITFAIYFAIPQEPANFVLGIRDTDANHATPGMVAEAHHRLGLDRPIPVQYAKFVSRTLHGDFGISWQGLSYDPNANLVGAHVGAEVVRAAAVTGWLALGGIVLVVVFAIPAATFAATRVGSWPDRTLLAVTLVGVSTHPIVIGVILQTFAGNRWHVVPPGGYCALAGKTVRRGGRLGETVST
jgi:peptide/nickel transport system permease protein